MTADKRIYEHKEGFDISVVSGLAAKSVKAPGGHGTPYRCNTILLSNLERHVRGTQGRLENPFISSNEEAWL